MQEFFFSDEQESSSIFAIWSNVSFVSDYGDASTIRSHVQGCNQGQFDNLFTFFFFPVFRLMSEDFVTWPYKQQNKSICRARWKSLKSYCEYNTWYLEGRHEWLDTEYSVLSTKHCYNPRGGANRFKCFLAPRAKGLNNILMNFDFVCSNPSCWWH